MAEDEATGSPPQDESDPEDDGVEEPRFGQFARATAPPELDNPEKRKRWKLPEPGQEDKTGPYIIELNALNIGGLPGAANAFLELHRQAMEGASDAERKATTDPRRISKSYYSCRLADRAWRTMIALDEGRPIRERVIYRLWPDFPVGVRTDRSVTTIKADAAVRTFDANGEGISWAVIDSGVHAAHLHFGDPTADIEDHSLCASIVVDLHRSFADVYERRNGVPVNVGPLEDPDADPAMDPQKRQSLIEQHRAHALSDEYGHGTHVAGILAGRAPDQAKVRALEHQYVVDPDGNKLSEKKVTRKLSGKAVPRGVAPGCKLVSLRVLDDRGKGRASQVIQALEYVRERINDNPKIMRVHGINLSVGYEFDAEMFACGQSPLCTTVDRLVQEGVVVVTAAGNTGYGNVAAKVGTSRVGLSNTINDPGNAELAITVGATHRDSPHLYGVSYFSSKGPTADGRLKPDLVAPGERITSCAVGSRLKDAGPIDPDAAYYVDDTGTSMAAPHVSGAIAAFLSIRREFIGRPQEVKKIFLGSATPLGRERYFEGHGLVDLMRAIQSV